MKINLTYLLFLLIPLQLASCQTKLKNMEEQFEWHETMSNPTGYPTEVINGGLISEDGTHTSLFLGLHKGPWGSSGRSMRSGLKQIPSKLDVTWRAYAEDLTYTIETEIDYNKILSLFKEGFYLPSMNDENPEPRKEKYSEINVGFAPGGVVVIWISGLGRKVEIGRYKGQEITIPEEEIAKFDGSLKVLFTDGYRESVMTNNAIISPELQKQNKPIPYDLWDSYRVKYNWELIVNLPEKIRIKEVWKNYYNGEKCDVFGDILIEQFPEIPHAYKWNNSMPSAIPNEIDFLLINEITKEEIACDIEFNENEIFSAYNTILKDNPGENIRLSITFNELMSYASIQLVGKDKEIAILKSNIKIY